jgi:cytosine/adenosine deaminase-related metal-dependent hydrolase
MTTVHDWCHNIRSREFAERDLAALTEAGIRARFSYGWAQGQDDKDPLNIADIEAWHRDWSKHSNDGLITLGLGWRGMFRAGPLPENVYRSEFEAARTMGIPITVHIASRKTAPNQIEAHAKAKLLGKDVQLVQLRPGKRADIIMVNTRALNMGGFVDPAHLLVGSALPENVDTVIIDGRILKQSGKLTALSTSQVVAEARSAWKACGSVRTGGRLVHFAHPVLRGYC